MYLVLTEANRVERTNKAADNRLIGKRPKNGLGANWRLPNGNEILNNSGCEFGASR